MAATTSGLMTFADLEQLPDDPLFRYELHHGELVKVPPPKHRHYRIQQRLRDLLKAAAGNNGEVGTELGFRATPEHEYRLADVGFVSRERWDRIPPDENLSGAPEIVIEVLSPSNSAAEILDREQLCLEHGSVEFWVVDPRGSQVKVSTADGRTVTYKSGGQIPLLFGGSLPVSEIFGN